LQAERRVQEGNLLAGEPVWRIATHSGEPRRFTIQSTAALADFMECSLDLERGLLTCSRGEAIGSTPLRFELPAGDIGTLRCGTAQYTLDEAVLAMLDELVWTEEDEGPENHE
jgi:hypothetical protein